MKILWGNVIVIILYCLMLAGCTQGEKTPGDTLKQISGPVSVRKSIDFQTIQKKTHFSKFMESFGENGIEKFRMKVAANPKRLRVAYFGDSIVEGDIITIDLRRVLQQKLGGQGIGYIPVFSPTASLRPNIKTVTEGDWKYYNLVNRGDAKYFGLDGSVAIPSANINKPSSVSFSLAQGVFSMPGFFYRFPRGSGHIQLEKSGGQTESLTLQNSDEVQFVRFNAQNERLIKLSFLVDDKLEAFGLIEDCEEGIQIDNLALRGHNGLGLRSISQSFLRAFTQRYQYDLIVLQYGINVLNDEIAGYGWYQKGLFETLQYLKTAFPDAGFLIVSVSDRGKQEGTQFVSYKKTNELVAAQRAAAKQFGASFYNLFEAMGGECSMSAWVENKMAAADYTHLNFKGGGLVARMLSETMF